MDHEVNKLHTDKEWSKGWGEGTLTWEGLGGSLSHSVCWGAAVTFGCVDWGAGLVALVSVAVCALSGVGKSVRCALPNACTPVWPKRVTFRAWPHHLSFS